MLYSKSNHKNIINNILTLPGRLVMAVVMALCNIYAMAESPLTISSAFQNYTTKTYTITAAGNSNTNRHQLYASSSSASSLTATSSSSSITTDNVNYLFAFVQDPNNTDNYYLYNVGTKKFVTSVSSDITAHLYTASDGTLTPVYVYEPTTNDALGNDDGTYNKAISFGNSSVSFGTSGSHNTGSNTNTENHVLMVSSGSAGISDWNYLGGQGNYSLQITETTTEFTASDLAAAQRRLVALSTDYSSKSFDNTGIKTNTKLYTIRTNPNAGETTYRGGLYATTSGLTSTHHAGDVTFSQTDALQQFVFVTDPNDATKVYLYSPAMEKFVSGSAQSSGTQTWSNISAAQIYVSNTNSYDYPYAFAFTDSPNWHTESGSDGTGSTNINLNGSGVVVGTYSKFDAGNCFEVSEAGDFSQEELTAAQSFLKGYAQTTFSDASLTTNSVVYTLQNEDGSYLSATSSGLTTSTTAGVNEQFVFFTPTTSSTARTRASGDDAVYLYSVGQGQFITSSKTLGTASQIYAFSTSDAHGYNLALGFSDTWTSTDNVAVGTTTTDPDKANRFKVADVTTQATTYKLAWATDAYNGVYTKSTLDELGLSPNKVYYLYSDYYDSNNNRRVIVPFTNEDRMGYGTVNSSSNVEANLNSHAYHFAFVTDESDPSKIYLYSLSHQKAANSSGLLVNGNDIEQIYVYASHNSEYPLALSFSSTTWNEAGSANINISGAASANDIATTYTTSGANRFKFIEVTDDAYDLTTARAAIKGWLTGEFHYRGASGRALQSNGMQSVSEVDYYYYVDTNRKQYGLASNENLHAIDLQLPFQRYLSRNANNEVVNTYSGQESNGNNYEPKAYIRWYNYNTDQKVSSERLIPWADADNAKASGNQSYDNTTQRLTDLYAVDGTPLGLYYHPTTSYQVNPNAASVGVAYVIPTDDYDSWTGDDIACDVSFYTDYNVPMSSDKTGNYDGVNQSLNDFNHEPTLSMRYIYHIRPAKEIANNLRNALITTTSGLTNTLSEKGVLTFGAKDVNATMNLRTDLQDIRFYYFYPVTDPDAHHVYHESGDAYGISESNIPNTTNPVEASSLEYRVYTSDKKYWRVFYTGTSRLFSISVNGSTNPLNGSDWKALDGSNAATTPTIAIGDHCYIVGYAVNGTDKCPFFNARLDITSSYPMTDDQISSGNHTNRTTSYLESHFGSPVASFTFDNEDASQTYGAPSSTAIPNLSSSSIDVCTVPSPFATRQYSYLYTTLSKFRENLGYNLYYGSTYSVLHGDYELFKYRNVYDRTHIEDNSRYGYFLYTDASDESRTLGYQDFTGSLCSGSQLVISAWVSNSAGGANDAQPELRFILYGIEKDASGNVTSSKQIASLCSGDFANNIADYNRGDFDTWYQVFGVVTLPTESGVGNYTDFRVVIDNFCTSTNGADYAIDDIKIYQSNSKLTVIQIPAMCSDNDANNVNIKIKGNYSVIQDLAGTSGKIYYRFVKSDGTAVTGDNFYGTGYNNYGVATVPSSYSESATLDNGEKQFEVSSITGVQEIVLVNHSFNLDPNTTYYVSAAYDNGSGEPATWGMPSNICSLYSDNFQLVEQKIYLNGTTSSTAEVNVACDGGEPVTYSPITIAITAPDKINGGEISLSNVHYDWFRGTLARYKAIKDANGNTLAGAIDHYRAAYDTGEYSSSNSPTTASNGMIYSDADKTLLEEYIGNDSLYMSGSTTLSRMTMYAGTNTILAIPIENSITASGQTYVLCTDPTAFVIRGQRNGPGLNLGMSNINYPSTETYRSIRIGFPQIREMGSTGTLQVPIASRTWKGSTVTDENLKFVNEIDASHSTYLYISNTNDPTITLANTSGNKIAEVASETLASTATMLELCNIDTTKLHEGYWYEVELRFQRTNVPTEDADITNCPNETFLVLKIVPEYLTWNPTADNGLNSNWNNDENWTRSTAGELYNAAYKDYRSATYHFTLYDNSGNTTTGSNANVDEDLTGTQPSSYVPMYFSKVIIPTLNNKPYPMLGYIRHQSGTNLILQMTNDKNHSATTNIQYDMEASPSTVASNGDSIYSCAVFDGNLCQQIYFKSDSTGGGQMRNQQYLNYQKAYVEIAQPINEWGTFTSPMKMTLAGDLYVPKETALQTTPLFQKITLDSLDRVNENGVPSSSGTYGLHGKPGKLYSRIKMPVYQKLWGNGGDMYTDDLSQYSSYDSPYTMLIYPSVDGGDNMDLKGGETYNSRRNAWSHTFNALGAKTSDSDDYSQPDKTKGRYSSGVGIAAKIGDDYTTDKTWVEKHKMQSTDTIAWALLRLPKDDETFSYKEYNNGEVNGSDESTDLEVYRTNNYRLGIDYNPVEGDLAEHTVSATELAVQPVSYEYPDDETKNLKYVLIGNPYTSSISVKQLVAANTDKLEKVTRESSSVNRVWVLSRNVLYELDPESESSTIAPGQAFFIKMQHPGFDDILFTARMQTDPNLHANAAKAMRIEDAAAKKYTVTRSTDVTNIIEHGVDTGMYCWSPSAGTLAVSGERIRRIEIYSIGGQLVQRSEMSGTEKQFSTGSGIYIVKATMSNGKTETKKISVR